MSGRDASEEAAFWKEIFEVCDKAFDACVQSVEDYDIAKASGDQSEIAKKERRLLACAAMLGRVCDQTSNINTEFAQERRAGMRKLQAVMLEVVGRSLPS